MSTHATATSKPQSTFPEQRQIKVAVITVSDRAYQGIYKDETGPRVAAVFPTEQYEVSIQRIVPDEVNAIALELMRCAEQERVDIIVTTGGAGCSQRDVTPEATLKIIQRDVPGLSDAIRLAHRTSHPNLMLSRGVSGIRNQSLIINLPGSPENAQLALETVLPAFPHFVKTVRQQRRPPKKPTPVNSNYGDNSSSRFSKPKDFNR